MKLLTKELEKKLPKLYATENVKPEDKVVVVKFFHPFSSWTWYAVEYDPIEQLFFGLMDGFEREWGYFSLSELQSNNIERDMYFDPKKISELNN